MNRLSVNFKTVRKDNL